MTMKDKRKALDHPCDLCGGKLLPFDDSSGAQCDDCGRFFLYEELFPENFPKIIVWNGMKLVKMSDVPGLQAWMYGQTMPLVADDPHPYDWVYYEDYRRFIRGLPIID